METIEVLRYKLRMFGITSEGPANVYCDNEAVTKNATIPGSKLNKKRHCVMHGSTITLHNIRSPKAFGHASEFLNDAA